MGEPGNLISLGVPSSGFCASPTVGSGEPGDSLESTFRRFRELPPSSFPLLVRAGRPILTASTQIRIATRFAAISDHISYDFHLNLARLQSRAREQRVAFARQLAMFLCRKITGASFGSIGAYFRRNHSTVIHAFRVIEQRTHRDAGVSAVYQKIGRTNSRDGPSDP